MPLSPLGWLNRIVPKDRGSRQIAKAQPFGPHPRHLLDLYAPALPHGPSPLLFFIYGGGWDDGARGDYEFAGRAFASLGFLTAVADYRLVPEVHFPAFVEDNALAADWLVRHAGDHGGDGTRMVLAGHSAGAYNAVMLGMDPARFGAPALAGRIAAVVGLSGPYDFYPFDVRASINAFANAPDPAGTQPVNLVTGQTPPMFLGHGDRDRVVGPYHTVNLAARLREAGVPVVEKHYPRLAHPAPLLALIRPLRPFSPVYRDVASYLGDLAHR